ARVPCWGAPRRRGWAVARPAGGGVGEGRRGDPRADGGAAWSRGGSHPGIASRGLTEGERMSGSSERMDGSDEALMADVAAVVAVVRDGLHELAERALALRAEGSYGAEHVTAMAASLEPLCVNVLGRSRMIEGMGI